MTMTTRSRPSARSLAALVATLVLPITAHAAGVPESLTKLKGSSEANAGDAMARAGYQSSGSKESWGRKDAFWWSGGSRQCLRLTSRFGFVTGVAAVAAADCTTAAASGGVAGGRPGALTASDLLGLTRKAGETKLAAAGFNAVWIDEGKPEGVYMFWLNQRTGQCIAATVVADKFDQATDQPTNKCQ
jgi:hypothetical protein